MMHSRNDWLGVARVFLPAMILTANLVPGQELIFSDGFETHGVTAPLYFSSLSRSIIAQ